MARVKFEFNNSQGQTLAGLLETPPEGSASHTAVFAHCFTCGKDIAAASRISRALAKRGISVLRFDFTGLGNSDGDFANTNFSSNVDDLLAAANALTEKFQAPSLLIGHSLGGAAVLQAANRIDSLKGVVTIGAPATAKHVEHLFCDIKSELSQQGMASLKIGPREFNVKQQFIDDLDSHADTAYLRTLGVPLLVFHSPVDTIVDISEAGKIYAAAMHPKSFVSLDNADHLLSDRDDSEYVAATLTAWAQRYLNKAQYQAEQAQRTAPELPAGVTRVTELDNNFLRGIYTQSHQLLVDEPVSFGGSNLGPNPYDLLLMSLGACTSMTIRMYANHKQWPLSDVTVDLVHEKRDANEFTNSEQQDGKLDVISRNIEIKGDLDDTQRARLLEIADRCPIHRTLENSPMVISKLV